MQNVSDVLSSAAFLNLATAFPSAAWKEGLARAAAHKQGSRCPACCTCACGHAAAAAAAAAAPQGALLALPAPADAADGAAPVAAEQPAVGGGGAAAGGGCSACAGCSCRVPAVALGVGQDMVRGKAWVS